MIVMAFYQYHDWNNLWVADYQWGIVKVSSSCNGVNSLSVEAFEVEYYSPCGSSEVGPVN